MSLKCVICLSISNPSVSYTASLTVLQLGYQCRPVRTEWFQNKSVKIQATWTYSLFRTGFDRLLLQPVKCYGHVVPHAGGRHRWNDVPAVQPTSHSPSFLSKINHPGWFLPVRKILNKTILTRKFVLPRTIARLALPFNSCFRAAKHGALGLHEILISNTRLGISNTVLTFYGVYLTSS